MTEDSNKRPISWASSTSSHVIGEDKQREQSQDVSKRLTSLVDHKDRNNSEWEISYDVMEEE